MGTLKGKLRDLNFHCELNNLNKLYVIFTHGLPEKQVFSFHLYYFSSYLTPATNLTILYADRRDRRIK